LDILGGAAVDLAALEVSDLPAYAAVTAFLEEAENDPDLVDAFTTRGDLQLGTWLANVKPWKEARKQGFNLYRIRVLNTPATSYRVVYGYDWRQRRIGILAIRHKDEIDYDHFDDALANRIRSDWELATGGYPT
jgi:hypothetical protein